MSTLHDTTAQTPTLAVDANTSNPSYPFAGASLSAQKLDSIIDTIAQLKGFLPPMSDLTPLDRQRMSKLGMRTRGFADAALEAAQTDPGLLPQSIPLASFVAQDALLRDLSLVQTHVADLKSRLDDALLLVGNHVYSVSRTVYAMMKTDAAKARLQEQKALMKQRFATKKTSQPADKSIVRE
jgi:hypothetical protein